MKAQNHSFRLAAVTAAEACALGECDRPVVLAASCPPILGESGMVNGTERTAPAIDVLRHIVSVYDYDKTVGL